MSTKKILKKIKFYLGNKYVLTLVLFAIWITFFDRANLINWVGTLRESEKMKREKRYYTQEIKRIDQSFSDLNNNNESLEKFARENYFFKNKNEDVYIIEEIDED